MIAKKAAKALILSFSLLLALSACGELSTPLFTSGGTYQVKALVNGNSLESCSIIRQDDKIIPYFAVSVVNDPDLTGLLVYLQNPKGEIVGERVLYTIEPVDEAVQPETLHETEKTETTKPEDNAAKEDEDFKDNDSAVSEANDTTAASGGAASAAGKTTGQTEAELSKQETGKKAPADTKSPAKKYDTAVLIKSFERELPYFPLPKNMEIGSYSLVFEAVGRSGTLSLTESDIFYLGSAEFRLKDISMYLPWFSDTRLIPPGVAVMLEASLDFDSRLNPYVIWYNGRNIIAEGNISEGAGNILWKTPEQSGFYSLRLEVLPYRLKRGFTGIFREITIPVSTKASQTGYFFENGPDYPTKRPLASGTVYSEQVKLAAAANKTATTPVVPPKHPELLRLYRFDGSLDEAGSIPDRAFEPSNETVLRWAAVGQSYGLSAGPDDAYLLRPIRFIRQGQDEGGGIFLFHIRPVAEGAIFSAFFPMLASASALASASNGVWMDMAMRENAVTLRLRTRESSVEIPVAANYSEGQKLIPIVVEFYIRPYRFEAKLSLGEDPSMQGVAEIKLPGALAGEGRIKLGVDKTAPGNITETENSLVLPNLPETEATAKPGQKELTQKPAETESPPADSIARVIPAETAQPESASNENKTPATAVAAVTTIWDEFAVLYSTTPILPEEIPVDNDSEDSAFGETENDQNEETLKTSVLSQTPAAPLAAAMEQKHAETEGSETPSRFFIP